MTMRGSVWLMAAAALVVVAWSGAADAGGTIKLRLDSKPEPVRVPEAEPARKAPSDATWLAMRTDKVRDSDVTTLAITGDKIRGDADLLNLAITGDDDGNDTQLVRHGGWGGGGYRGGWGGGYRGGWGGGYRGGWGGYGRGYGWGGYGRGYGWGGYGYRGYGWGGYGYRGYGWGGYRGYGWGGYYRPYWGWGWGGYYQPWGYYSYYSPYIGYGYPSYSYYPYSSYDYPAGVSYYYDNANGAASAAPVTDLSIQPRTLTPSDAQQAPPANGTYPYDGGPSKPVPMPQRKSDTAPMNQPRPSVPLEGKVVSLPSSTPTPVKYTYPAYGDYGTTPIGIKLRLQTAQKP